MTSLSLCHFYVCISVLQPVRNMGIEVFAGIAYSLAFDVGTSFSCVYLYIYYLPYIHNLESIQKTLRIRLEVVVENSPR